MTAELTGASVAFLLDDSLGRSPINLEIVTDHVLAIEQEAIKDERKRLRAAVEGLLPPVEGTIHTMAGHDRPASTPADFVELYRAAVLALLSEGEPGA